ncbi:MAG: HK97 gp10 family phage protein [Lachnospiraceae bacterium]|nr:HK97 gp10 family phage protein [Lachnospiraceae bacterium]
MAEFNLERAMRDILQDYSVEVAKAAEEAVTEVSKEATKKLRQTSPKRSGKYGKGWASKVEKTATTAEATVYGKTGTYQLAHLLENGHAKRGGGRVSGNTHIKPVEDWAISEVEKRIREKVER